MENKEKSDKPEGVKLVELVKETDLAFQTPDGKNLDLYGYLTWLGNEILKLRKALG